MSAEGRIARYSIAALAALVLMAVAAGVVHTRFSRQLYTARTTLIETPASVAASPVKGNRLTYLVTLATSQRVLTGAASTMADLGVKTPPNEVLSHTRVYSVPNTNVIAVETTLEDRLEAKIAADVVASEFRKAFAYSVVKELQNKVDMLDHRSRSAERQLDECYAALAKCKEISSSAADLAKAEADAKVATDAYAEAQTQYNKAKLELDRAKQTIYIKTIDPAYVYPAKRRFIF